jgi:tape measure domain-containing protein
MLAGPLMDAAQAGLEYNKTLENASVSFETLIGSAVDAKKHIGDLQRFAATTPFEFTGLIRASQLLQGMGFEHKQVIPVLTGVGNALSAMGRNGAAEVERVTMALGQMSLKGKVSAEEINQLAEAGLPAWELLAKAIGKTVEETQELSEKGMLRGREAAIAIAQQANLKFNGQMGRMSETYEGRLSNFNDNMQARLGDAARSGFELMKEVYKTGGEFLGTETAKGMAQSLSEKLAPTFKFIADEMNLLSKGEFKEAGKHAVKEMVGAMTEGIREYLPMIAGTIKEVLPQIIPALKDLSGFVKTEVVDPLGKALEEAIRKAMPETAEKADKVNEFLNEQGGMKGKSLEGLKEGIVGDPSKMEDPVDRAVFGAARSFWDWLTGEKSPKYSERDQLLMSGQELFQQGGRRQRNLTDVLREEERKLKPVDPRANERVNLLPDVTAPGDIIRVLTETNESIKQVPPAVNTLTETFRFWTEKVGGDGAAARPIAPESLKSLAVELPRVAAGADLVTKHGKLLWANLGETARTMAALAPAVYEVNVAEKERLLGFQDIVRQANHLRSLKLNLSDTFDDLIQSLTYDSTNWAEHLKRFSSNLLNNIFRELEQSLVERATKGQSSSLGEFFGKAAGDWLGGLLGFKKRPPGGAAPNVGPKQPPLALDLPGLKDLGDTIRGKADELGQKITRQTEQIGSKLDRQSGQLNQVTSGINELSSTILASSGGDGFWGSVLKGALSGAVSGLTGGLLNGLSFGGGESGGGYKGAPSGGYYTGSHGVPLRVNTPQRAVGGPVSAGTLYQVNESELEFFRPNSGGQVIPLSRMKAAQRQGEGSGLTVINYFTIRAENGRVSRESEQQVASAAARGIERAHRRNR